MISIIIFLPAVCAALLLATHRDNHRIQWAIALGGSLLTLLLCIPLGTGFDPTTAALQYVDHAAWMPALGISYKVGVDGLSLPMILLTALLTPLAILASVGEIGHRLKQFLACMLLLETGMMGVFAAMDLFVFYVFWEVMLIPMVLLIGIWGGEQRVYAAVKFILYTMGGSLFMLVAIVALYFLTGTQSFDYEKLRAALSGDGVQVALSTQRWLFLGFAAAFVVKVPVFPFHTWLPDAHVQAPTAGSMILAGVLLKMGTYGLARFCIGLFPAIAIELAWMFCVLGVVGIIYGALVSMVQTDMKKLIAYSSISHLGFVVLGLFTLNAQGVSGAVLQMVNHGLSTGALFFLVGVLYTRRHTKKIADFGGIASVAPLLSGVFLVVSLSSIGLPGLNGFVGEFLILVGAFRYSPTLAAFAAAGVILAAVYMLWMYQRVFFGPIVHEANRGVRDLDAREIAVLLPLLAGIVLIGLWPMPWLRMMDASVADLLRPVAQLLPHLSP
jgi:NADH-quinone oxidoreductase subunit M